MSATALAPRAPEGGRGTRGSTNALRWFVALAGLLCSSCAPPLMKLPASGALPAADGAAAIQDATKACRTVSSISAAIAVSGSVAGHRLSASLLAGLAAPASARLEAVAPFGQPLFIFVTHDNSATLLLPRDRRFLEQGRPAEVLEATAGVPLDAGDLRTALTGCAASPRPDQAKQLGEDWRIVPDGLGEVYLHRDGHTGPWRIVAAVHDAAGATPSWRSEYRDFQGSGAAAGLPAAIRLTSLSSKQFDLRLSMSQVEINAALDAEVFRVQIPQGAERITVEELKRSGPLSNASNGK